MAASTTKSVLLVATVGLLGFVAGINKGYTQGYNAAVNSRSADASMFAMVMTSLDAENVSQARVLLEGHLDLLLIQNTIGRAVSPFVL